jgi:FO synthase
MKPTHMQVGRADEIADYLRIGADERRVFDRLLSATAAELTGAAAALRDTLHGVEISYSRKVFIPLTQLCRDSCHYCTFAHPPVRGQRAFMSRDAVLSVARAGAAAGCTEALFTLGERPEQRYRVAAEELAAFGHGSTLSYLAELCAAVLRETGLLPHINAGTMSDAEMAALRPVSVSQGLMLETIAERLSARGGPHFGSPDKLPLKRLETIASAGRLGVPFTTGILIGIGETREERLEALLALRQLHERYGHIQEIIIQNFRRKPGTRMATAMEPDFDELLWTVAAARILFGGAMNIQAPPNLSAGNYGHLIEAGINDWGGISPVTVDHVNPEAPWPEIAALERETAAFGKQLIPRLPIYPSYALAAKRWVDPKLVPRVLAAMDAVGYARADAWAPGTGRVPQLAGSADRSLDQRIKASVERARNGEALAESDLAHLFTARGPDFHLICEAADEVRRQRSGEIATYVVNRNVNYTNVCTYGCRFCAFSKGKLGDTLRGAAYTVDTQEVARRAIEAWERGASEICMQGGIHPSYTGQTYLDLAAAVTEAVPGMHIHAFSPLEIKQGAATLGWTIPAFLGALKEAGLATLPGTAAEILDDEVRAELCPDKLNTAEWLDIIRAAHGLGLRTTATIMFGHVDHPIHWARHLLRIRALQAETGGFTEFVPLPFVHMEAPIYLKGRARKGPTFRETLLMHAIARLALTGLIDNIQASWVKLGSDGVAACLNAGANDLGGTLMNESISRAAGTTYGQELPPAEIEALIRGVGRIPQQRSTLYDAIAPERQRVARAPGPLAPLQFGPASIKQRDREFAL